MASRKLTENEISAAQRRLALTVAYLRVACPSIDPSTRRKLADSILALIDGEDHRSPQKITDCASRKSRNV